MVEGFAAPDDKDLEAARVVREAAQVASLPVTERPSEDMDVVSCSVKAAYLVSFSMPDRVIEDLLTQAVRLNERCGKRVVSLGIRGFVNQNMKETLGRIWRIVKDSSLAKKDLPLNVTPDLFKKYDVSEVPFIIVRDDRGERTLKGDVSIEYALYEGRDGERNGRTYRVEEKDFYQVIGERVMPAGFRIVTFYVSGYAGRFSKAEKDRVFYIDPAYTVSEDVKDAEGRIVVKKGTVIHPADYAALGRYVVIDGTDEKEIAFALKEKPAKVIIVAGDPLELSRKHKTRFFAADDSLVYGFRLEKTPSIVEQEGRYVRVTEKKL